MTSISDKVAAAWDALVAVYTLTETYSHSQDAKEAWANKAYWARIIASDIRRGKSFVSILASWNSVDDGYGIPIAKNEAAGAAAYAGSDEQKIAHFAGGMAKGLRKAASDVHKKGDKQLQAIQKALERTARAWEEIEKEALQ